MINQLFVEYLVTWIKNGTTNIKTGQPFKVDDIIDADYKAAVQTTLNTTTTT